MLSHVGSFCMRKMLGDAIARFFFCMKKILKLLPHSFFLFYDLTLSYDYIKYNHMIICLRAVFVIEDCVVNLILRVHLFFELITE